MTRTRLGRVALLLLPLTVAAACTSGRGLPPESSPAASSTPPAPSTTAPATTPAPSSSSATRTPTSTSTPPPSPSSSSSTSSRPVAALPAFTTTCASLSVRVLKGGAIRGAEIAAMQFVNDGTTPCTITGTPTARLVRKGVKVGTRSAPSGATVRPVTLQPGDYGESLLRDFSTCEAPLSDNLRLRLPTRGGTAGRTITEPIQLRACTLQAAPVGPPS